MKFSQISLKKITKLSCCQFESEIYVVSRMTVIFVSRVGTPSNSIQGVAYIKMWGYLYEILNEDGTLM